MLRERHFIWLGIISEPTAENVAVALLMGLGVFSHSTNGNANLHGRQDWKSDRRIVVVHSSDMLISRRRPSVGVRPEMQGYPPGWGGGRACRG